LLRAQGDIEDAQKRANRGRSGASAASSAGMSMMEEPLVVAADKRGEVEEGRNEAAER